MKNNYHSNAIPKVPPFLAWLFPYKIKKLPLNTNSSVGYYLLQNKISLTFINWIFQGMRGMGRADLLGKIILEVICIAAFLLILDGNIFIRIIVAFVFGHTINWLVNSHFWVFGRFLGITRTSPRRFFPYIREMMSRVNDTSSIPTVIVIGGISRNQGFKTTSDVDVIFIRRKGFQNAVKAVLATIRERALAFFKKFPLDLELYNSIESMKQHRTDEVPIVLKDIDGVAKDWYCKAGRAIAGLDDYE